MDEAAFPIPATSPPSAFPKTLGFSPLPREAPESAGGGGAPSAGGGPPSRGGAPSGGGASGGGGS